MNIFEKISNQDKVLIIIRKLKEGFLGLTDDLLEVFPNNKNLFLQRIISYQIPDTILYKLLKKNINVEFVKNKDEYYLKYELCFLKEYNTYINENNDLNINCIKSNIFKFDELCKTNQSSELIDENIDLIWKWIEILISLIKNIDTISEKLT